MTEDTGGKETQAAREAPRELLAFACAVRPDWPEDEVWNAMHAARTAGLGWKRIALRLVDIAFREEDPPTRPRELWDHARGLTARTGAGPATEEFRDALAALKARNTGPLQRLREQDDDAPPGAA